MHRAAGLPVHTSCLLAVRSRRSTLPRCPSLATCPSRLQESGEEIPPLALPSCPLLQAMPAGSTSLPSAVNADKPSFSGHSPCMASNLHPQAQWRAGSAPVGMHTGSGSSGRSSDIAPAARGPLQHWDLTFSPPGLEDAYTLWRNRWVCRVNGAFCLLAALAVLVGVQALLPLPLLDSVSLAMLGVWLPYGVCTAYCLLVLAMVWLMPSTYVRHREGIAATCMLAMTAAASLPGSLPFLPGRINVLVMGILGQVRGGRDS